MDMGRSSDDAAPAKVNKRREPSLGTKRFTPSTQRQQELVPFAERTRFRRANKNDEEAAAAQLNGYLEWRRNTLPLPNNHPQLGVDLPEMISVLGGDEDDLGGGGPPAESSSSSTSQVRESAGGGGASPANNVLPPAAADETGTSSGASSRYAPGPRDARTGNRCLLFLAAMYSSDLATSGEYLTAIAARLEEIFDRESEEKFTVLIDTRAGRGWANPLVGGMWAGEFLCGTIWRTF